MILIPFLIGIPAVLAVIFPFMHKENPGGLLVYARCRGLSCCRHWYLLSGGLLNGAETTMLYMSTEIWDHLIAVGDIFLMCLILYMSFKYRKLLPAILSVAQTILALYVDITAGTA